MRSCLTRSLMVNILRSKTYFPPSSWSYSTSACTRWQHNYLISWIRGILYWWYYSFWWKNTPGNTTLLRISGPGLPSVGVPVNDLNGIPGSGSNAPVKEDRPWKFRVVLVPIVKVSINWVHPAVQLQHLIPRTREKTASISILFKKAGVFCQSSTKPDIHGWLCHSA